MFISASGSATLRRGAVAVAATLAITSMTGGVGAASPTATVAGNDAASESAIRESAAGDAAVDSAIEANLERIRELRASSGRTRHGDIAERPASDALGDVTERHAPDSVGDVVQATRHIIDDPRGDVPDSRADIVEAGINMLADGMTVVGMTVVSGTNPNTWGFDSAAMWQLDIDGDWMADYFIALMSDDDGAFAAVVDIAADGVVCWAESVWDVAEGFYGVVFPTACVNNPGSARWQAGMEFQSILDLAPDDSAWAGPAINAAAPSSTSSPSLCPSRVTAPNPSSQPLVTVDPARVFDSRAGGGPRPAGSITEITVAGCANVPPGSVGVVLNVTALEAQTPGYLTVYPCGTAVPDASNVNYTFGDTVANTAVARLGTDGRVCVYTSAVSGLLVDVTGYLPDGSDVVVRPPARFHDTRAVGGPAAPGSVTEIQVAGRSGVPDNPAVVVLNVTALEAQAPGYLTVFPCGGAVPDASNVNYTTDQTVPNAVIARVGSNGNVCVYTSEATGLLVDASGFVPSGSSFAGITPARMYDTRSSGGHRAGGSVTEVQITGNAGIPDSASTVALNVTALDAQGPGYLTVYPCGTAVPDASNVNYTTGATVPNAVVAKIGAGGTVCVFTSAESGLLVDATGHAP